MQLHRKIKKLRMLSLLWKLQRAWYGGKEIMAEGEMGKSRDTLNIALSYVRSLCTYRIFDVETLVVHCSLRESLTGPSVNLITVSRDLLAGQSMVFDFWLT
jgi:hypothetical protein